LILLWILLLTPVDLGEEGGADENKHGDI